MAVATWEGKELLRALLAENKVLLQMMLQSCGCTEIITDKQLEEGKIYCLTHLRVSVHALWQSTANTATKGLFAS